MLKRQEQGRREEVHHSADMFSTLANHAAEAMRLDDTRVQFGDSSKVSFSTIGRIFKRPIQLEIVGDEQKRPSKMDFENFEKTVDYILFTHETRINLVMKQWCVFLILRDLAEAYEGPVDRNSKAATSMMKRAAEWDDYWKAELETLEQARRNIEKFRDAKLNSMKDSTYFEDGTTTRNPARVLPFDFFKFAYRDAYHVMSMGINKKEQQEKKAPEKALSPIVPTKKFVGFPAMKGTAKQGALGASPVFDAREHLPSFDLTEHLEGLSSKKTSPGRPSKKKNGQTRRSSFISEAEEANSSSEELEEFAPGVVRRRSRHLSREAAVVGAPSDPRSSLGHETEVTLDGDAGASPDSPAAEFRLQDIINDLSFLNEQETNETFHDPRVATMLKHTRALEAKTDNTSGDAKAARRSSIAIKRARRGSVRDGSSAPSPLVEKQKEEQFWSRFTDKENNISRNRAVVSFEGEEEVIEDQKHFCMKYPAKDLQVNVCCPRYFFELPYRSKAFHPEFAIGSEKDVPSNPAEIECAPMANFSQHVIDENKRKYWKELRSMRRKQPNGALFGEPGKSSFCLKPRERFVRQLDHYELNRTDYTGPGYRIGSPKQRDKKRKRRKPVAS